MIDIQGAKAENIMPNLLHFFPVKFITFTEKFNDDHLIPSGKLTNATFKNMVVSRLGMGDRIPAVSLINHDASGFSFLVHSALTSHSHSSVPAQPSIYEKHGDYFQQLSVTIKTTVCSADRGDITKATRGNVTAQRVGGKKQAIERTKGYIVSEQQMEDKEFLVVGNWDIQNGQFQISHYESKKLPTEKCRLIINGKIAERLNNSEINSAISKNPVYVSIK